MLRNYLKIAFRNLFRHRTYSLINVLGLGLGLATGFLMLLWVNNEYSMNRYHSNADRIYQINSHLKIANESRVWENSPAYTAGFVKSSLPDIEEVVRIKSNYGYKHIVKHTNQVFVEDGVGYSENELFRVFDIIVRQGNPSAPFAPGMSAVMTESTAKKYFGNDDPIGKVLKFRDTTAQVSAVIADFPANSSMRFNILFSMDFLRAKFRANAKAKTLDDEWNNHDYLTYCLARKDANLQRDASIILQQFKSLNDQSSIENISFRPLSKIYLYNADGSKGQIVLVEIFFIIAVFVLLIACINYINLVTARATQRVKEISIRKIVGAEKRQLFFQFLTETGVLLLVSALTCFLLIELMLPVYRFVSGNALSYQLSDPQVWKVLGTIILAVWLLSGLYPALLLSAFNPFRSLKGTGFLSNAGVLRKSLVVLQFVVSITLLLSTVFIHRQMRYVQEKDLNINTDNVLCIPTWKLKPEAQAAFRKELQAFTAIQDLTVGDISLFEGVNTTTGISWKGKGPDEVMTIARVNVDKNFLGFFSARIKEGTDFANVSPDQGKYILNETAIKRMGLKNPIGETIEYNGETGVIIGVVKDFYFQSFRDELMPAIINYTAEDGAVVYAKVRQEDAQSVIAFSQKLWKSFELEQPMEYGFMDERIAMQYDRESRAATLFDAFTLITLFISCLGLFGLATHSAERRVKEIGIRKVMGAGNSQLAALLSKEFLMLVIIAIFISVPIVWMGMQKVLDYFAYRITLDWWVFALTSFAAILAAIITVSFQAVKAAMENPVKSLRTE